MERTYLPNKRRHHKTYNHTTDRNKNMYQYTQVKHMEEHRGYRLRTSIVVTPLMFEVKFELTFKPNK
jgi:hypothetical protein